MHNAFHSLITVVFRQNIQKALGFAPSRAASKQVSYYSNNENIKYRIVAKTINEGNEDRISRIRE